jgi:hypothetical protein
MTVGNTYYNASNVPGAPPSHSSIEGTIETRVWTGEDRPKREKLHFQDYSVLRDGKTLKIHRRTIYSAPLRVRRSDDEHNYDIQIRSNQSVRVATYLGTSGPFISNTSSDQSPISTDSLTVSLFDANDNIALANKLREKLRGSDFDASVFLGEGLQSLRMVADAAIRIRKGLSHIRRFDVAGAARSLLEGTSRSPIKPYTSMNSAARAGKRTVANNWIELQYGWLPLLQDAQAGAEQLAWYLQAPLETRVSVSRRKESSGTQDKYSGSYALDDGTYQYRWVRCNYAITERKRLTVYIQERPSEAALLGLTSPENVAWELLPWSFVADWFIPIGDYLTARGLSSIVPGKYITGHLRKGVVNPPFWVGNGNGGSDVTVYPRHPTGGYPATRGKKHSVHYSRSVGSDLTVPLPSFKPLAKAASWRHCANAVALLTQQFAGRVRP